MSRKEYKNLAAKLAVDYREKYRNEIMDLKLNGDWTPYGAKKFAKKYKLTPEEVSCLAEEAGSILRQLQKAAGGAEGIREEILGKARKAYENSMHRQGWGDSGMRELPPDTKAAISALTLIAKMEGLIVEQVQHTHIDPLAGLSYAELQEVVNTGKLPGQQPALLSSPAIQIKESESNKDESNKD